LKSSHKRRHGRVKGAKIAFGVGAIHFSKLPDPLSFLRGVGADVTSLLQAQSLNTSDIVNISVI